MNCSFRSFLFPQENRKGILEIEKGGTQHGSDRQKDRALAKRG